MRPFSPDWADPLGSSAPGALTYLPGGLRARIVGEGEPLVFLHGLGASLRYWGRGYDDLSSHFRLVFLDLLGFGGSTKPDGPYDVDQHVAALDGAVSELGLKSPMIVAHSAGALIAMHYAAANPASRVVAFGAPIFASSVQARRHLRSLGPLARLMADESPWAARLCKFMCSHRELSRSFAPLFATRLPAPVAADGVEHTWASYKGTFDLIVSQQETKTLLTSLGEQLTLIYGRGDRVCPVSQVKSVIRGMGGLRLSIARIGDHHLPLQFPSQCSALIRAQVT